MNTYRRTPASVATQLALLGQSAGAGHGQDTSGTGLASDTVPQPVGPGGELAA